jgi:hypothetical protein
MESQTTYGIVGQYGFVPAIYALIYNPDIINGRPVFTTTNDPLGIIEYGLPYPTGGLNLGMVVENFSVDPRVTEARDEPKNGADQTAFIYERGAEGEITCKLQLAGIKQVFDLFLQLGPRSVNETSGGGELNRPTAPLAAMIKNELDPRRLLCWLWYRVSPSPVPFDFQFGKYFVIDARFQILAGEDSNNATGLRDPGQQNFTIFWIDLNGNPIQN